MRRKKIEKLKELQLIVQVPLEPEDHFIVVREPPECIVTLGEAALELRLVAHLVSCEERGADPAQLGQGKVCRNRALVKDVAPRKNISSRVRRSYAGGHGIAVGDVQSAVHSIGWRGSPERDHCLP